MTIETTDYTLLERPEWAALVDHLEEIGSCSLRDLFEEDPNRGQTLSAEGAGLFLDFSKNRITAETKELLLALAEACGLRERMEKMFTGEKINITENRDVLHTGTG